MTDVAPQFVYDPESSQRALEALRILDTPRDERVDRITRLAADLFDVPMVSVSLLDRNRQWRKSYVGVDGAEAAREDSFCDYTVRQASTVVVPDARADDMFADNPFVTGDPNLRFYAGHPLSAPGGEHIGTLCIFDTKARTLDRRQTRMLQDLAGWVQAEIVAEAEIDQAALVQRALLPNEAPALPGYSFAAVAVAGGSLLGDVYDWYATGGGVRVTLADVMGKGIGAALIAAQLRASLRTAPERSVLTSFLAAEALIDREISGIDTFATAFHSHLDAASGDLTFVDAGHSLAYILRADDRWERLRSTGLPVGMAFGELRIAGTAHLEPGDILMCCSDGLIDVLDLDDPLGDVRAVLRSAGLAGAVDEAARRARDDVAPDDVTVVVVRRDA